MLTPRTVLFGVATAFAALFGLSVITGSFFTISEYERGVVTRNGALLRIAEPGLDYKLPFLDSVVDVPISIQQFTTRKLNTITEDNQEVDAILTVQYVYPPTELGYIYKNVGFTHEKLHFMVVDRWKTEAGKVNVTHLASNRGAIVERLRKTVGEEAKRLYRIEITDVQLTNLDYQDSFRKAQETAAVVKTQIEAAQNLKLKAEIEAKTLEIQAKGQAAQATELAKGEADRVRLTGDAQAASIRARGEAEADVQRAMADALTANPALVQMRQAERWNGILPQNIYAGAPLPILNFAPAK